MPHSKPCSTSRASSLNRFSDAMRPLNTSTLSRTRRTSAVRLIFPCVTWQPAIVPMREILKTLRTSTVPICSSFSSGLSMPSIAERISSTAS